MDSLVLHKAYDLYDSWVETNLNESGMAIPSFVEEELLANYDQQFGTDLMAEAVKFYERGGGTDDN